MSALAIENPAPTSASEWMELPLSELAAKQEVGKITNLLIRDDKSEEHLMMAGSRQSVRDSWRKIKGSVFYRILDGKVQFIGHTETYSHRPVIGDHLESTHDTGIIRSSLTSPEDVQLLCDSPQFGVRAEREFVHAESRPLGTFVREGIVDNSVFEFSPDALRRAQGGEIITDEYLVADDSLPIRNAQGTWLSRGSKTGPNPPR